MHDQPAWEIILSWYCWADVFLVTKEIQTETSDELEEVFFKNAIMLFGVKDTKKFQGSKWQPLKLFLE